MKWYEWVIPAIMISILGAIPILSVWALQKFLNDMDNKTDMNKAKRKLNRICKRCKRANKRCIKNDAYIGLCVENDKEILIEILKEKNKL